MKEGGANAAHRNKVGDDWTNRSTPYFFPSTVQTVCHTYLKSRKRTEAANPLTAGHTAAVVHTVQTTDSIGIALGRDVGWGEREGRELFFVIMGEACMHQESFSFVRRCYYYLYSFFLWFSIDRSSSLKPAACSRFGRKRSKALLPISFDYSMNHDQQPYHSSNCSTDTPGVFSSAGRI